MKKQTLALIGLLLILPSLLFAQWSFLYEGWSGHPRIGGGLVPTSLSIGLNYKSKWGTSVSSIGSFGYRERMLYQDPSSGALLASDLLLYDHFRMSSITALTQSIKDHHFSLGVEGSFERALDSMIVGTTLPSGTVAPSGSWSPASIYGNLTGLQGNAFFHYRYAGIGGTTVTGERGTGRPAYRLQLWYSYRRCSGGTGGDDDLLSGDRS